MYKNDIGLILMGILGTLVIFVGIAMGIALLFIASLFGKLLGIFIILAMLFFLVALWINVLN